MAPSLTHIENVGALGSNEASRADSSDQLKYLAEVAAGANSVFIIMLIGCLYSLLTIGITTDRALVTNISALRLPILDAEVPIIWFYYVAPSILLGVFIYFQLCMWRLWHNAAVLSRSHGQDISLEASLAPSLVASGILIRLEGAGSDRSKLVRAIEAFVWSSFVWLLVPLTSIAFWWRYLTRHDVVGTTYHVILIALSLLLALFFYRFITIAGLFRSSPNATRSSMLLRFIYPLGKFISRHRFTMVAILAITLVGFIAVMSRGVAVATHEEVNRMILSQFLPQSLSDDSSADESSDPADSTAAGSPSAEPDSLLGVGCRRDFSFGDCSIAVAITVFSAIGYNPHAKLEAAELSSRPTDWVGVCAEPECSDLALEMPSVTRALLQSGDLHHAFAPTAFLAGADLSKADVRWADFTRAELQGADLEKANGSWAVFVAASLQGANVKNADFTGADLYEARLDWAQGDYVKFPRATLQSAILNKAYLRGADFSDAKLQSAHLEDAKLNGSHFERADLGAAHMENAILSRATMTGAKLSNAVLPGADFSSAEMFKTNLESTQAQGAQFRDAKLIEAVLQFGQFLDADFTKANLTSANMNCAKLGKADFTSATLDGADLTRARLAQANFTSSTLRGARLNWADLTEATGLTQTQLDGACGNSRTVLPDGLHVAPCPALPRALRQFEGMGCE